MQSSFNNNHDKKNVNVYLLFPSSKAVKVCFNRFISYEQLQLQIKQLFSIQIEFQILYYKGRILRGNSMKQLTQNSIIHVGDKRMITEQVMTVYLIEYVSEYKNLFKATGLKLSIEVKPTDIIGESLKHGLIQKGHSSNIDYLLFISSGRFLNKNKSFKEQNIQNKAKIQIINKPFKQQHQIIANEATLKIQQQNKNHNDLQIYNDKVQYVQGVTDNFAQSQYQSFIKQDQNCLITEQIKQNNPQSLEKRASLQTFQQLNQEVKSKTYLKKVKSAKSLKSVDFINKNVVFKPPPMIFRLKEYKIREQGFVGQRQCNCVSKKHQYQNEQCIKNAELQIQMMGKDDQSLDLIKSGQKIPSKGLKKYQTLIT